jgi:hypothetical protein
MMAAAATSPGHHFTWPMRYEDDALLRRRIPSLAAVDLYILVLSDPLLVIVLIRASVVERKGGGGSVFICVEMI